MKRIFFIPLFLILLPKLAVAGPDDYVPSQIAVNTSTLPGVVIGPADAHTYPRVIGELAGTSNQYVFNGGAIALMRGKFTPHCLKLEVLRILSIKETAVIHLILISMILVYPDWVLLLAWRAIGPQRLWSP